jgi:hypothetical protein
MIFGMFVRILGWAATDTEKGLGVGNHEAIQEVNGGRLFLWG